MCEVSVNQTPASSFISTVTFIASDLLTVDCCLQAGVKNGMLMGEARRLCPDLVPIHYDFDAYREVSQTLYDTVARWALSDVSYCPDDLVRCLSCVHLCKWAFHPAILPECLKLYKGYYFADFKFIQKSCSGAY